MYLNLKKLFQASCLTVDHLIRVGTLITLGYLINRGVKIKGSWDNLLRGGGGGGKTIVKKYRSAIPVRFNWWMVTSC